MAMPHCSLLFCVPSITRCAKFETCDVVLPKEFSARRFVLLFQLHFHRGKPVAAAPNGASVSCLYICIWVRMCVLISVRYFVAVALFCFSHFLRNYLFFFFVLPFLSKKILFSSFSWGPMHFGWNFFRSLQLFLCGLLALSKPHGTLNSIDHSSYAQTNLAQLKFVFLGLFGIITERSCGVSFRFEESSTFTFTFIFQQHLDNICYSIIA